MKHLNINVYGLVQGVFFRASAKEEADKLNLTGFAKNMPDGSVYVEAEGEENNLEKLIKWCNKGPLMAQVDEVEVSEGSLKDFKEFRIS